ncbi:hypothetical protein M3Y99_01852400 [Aphelenchoides fujianensis]|nr:hypothetical protein M3Y99_01852400 [Aphelenchoides fujianensis]
MPPQLVPCAHCDRLYSHFSIGLHEPQCLSNPNRKVRLPAKRGTHSSSIGAAAKPLPALERRSRSVGSSSFSSASPQSSAAGSPTKKTAADEERPSTRTLNANGSEQLQKKTSEFPPRIHSTTARFAERANGKRRPKTPTQSLDLVQQAAAAGDAKRVCFVCGEQVPSVDLMIHELECEADWRTNRRDFPANIKVRSPRPMRIPSVDGTIDPRRLDLYALESAERARKARCIRCCRPVPFGDVHDHQCTRFEPTVQFYF